MSFIIGHEGGDSINIENDLLVQVKDICKYYKDSKFNKRDNTIKAVDKVSLKIYKGKNLGLVGESGCGKSTLGNLILRFIDSTSGEIFFEGQDITHVKESKLKSIRKKVQIVFQDVYSSLNPRMKAGDIVGEPLKNFKIGTTDEQREKVYELFKIVGLNEGDISKYPCEFSGGQRQRVAIAKALALNPELIILDEATSSLDVSIQAQILNLMRELNHKFNVTYLFISHDLAAVKYLSDYIAVMYNGKIVEMIESSKLVKEAVHPYTKTLLASVPIIGSKNICENNVDMESEDIHHDILGCKFYKRCKFSMDICENREPKFIKIGEKHKVSCHIFNKNV